MSKCEILSENHLMSSCFELMTSRTLACPVQAPVAGHERAIPWDISMAEAEAERHIATCQPSFNLILVAIINPILSHFTIEIPRNLDCQFFRQKFKLSDIPVSL